MSASEAVPDGCLVCLRRQRSLRTLDPCLLVPIAYCCTLHFMHCSVVPFAEVAASTCLATTVPTRLRFFRSTGLLANQHCRENELQHACCLISHSYWSLLLLCADVVPRCDLRADARETDYIRPYRSSALHRVGQVCFRWCRCGMRCALHFASRCCSRSSRSVIFLLTHNRKEGTKI
jgi:hypothetical protein